MKTVPYFSPSEGKGSLSLSSVFLRQPNINICVANVVGGTYTVFMEKVTRVFWGKIFQSLQSYNLWLCVNNWSMAFHPKLSIIGLIEASNLLFVTNLAALFWSFCRWWISAALQQPRTEQQYWKCGLTMLV